MNRFFAKEIQDGKAFLESDESYHLAMVLRMEIGQEIEVVFDGRLYLARIKNNDKRQAEAEIICEKEVNSEPNINVTLFQALPKGSKMDFAVQKCTELGVSCIVPIITKRCVAKAKEGKEDRLNRIAYEACKQCKRVSVPHVNKCKSLKDVDFSFYDLAIVAYEDENALSLKSVLEKREKLSKVALIIGPEGGFEREEIDGLKASGVMCVSLGRRILRSETAGMAALTAILYHYGEMEI